MGYSYHPATGAKGLRLQGLLVVCGSLFIRM